jgi:hypothetical protein
MSKYFQYYTNKAIYNHYFRFFSEENVLKYLIIGNFIG